jgi:polyribonucleotide nucleotidyltransferase
MRHTVRREIGGRTLSLETGVLAGQAGGAVTVRYGDNVLLATVCMSVPREGIDFFPLTVDFEERHYAAGRIPGSFFRREGRPSVNATLAARLTDRPIRPLFPKGFRNEVQIIATVLSVDGENPPDILSIIGASAALSISSIPFEGPIAGCRIGFIREELVVNPTFQQMEEGELELVVAGSRDAVVMVEAGAKEVPEATVLEALQRGQAVNQEIIAMILEMVQAVGQPKIAFAAPAPADPDLERRVAALLDGRLRAAVFSGREKGERDTDLALLRREVLASLGDGLEPQLVRRAFDELVDREFRGGILDRGLRPDGRGLRQVRPITAEVGVLPRTHGTGLFSRGQTQILSVCTLASMGMKQKLDTLDPQVSKRFLHHYNFPPYSVGEVRRVGSPGRREVGHGALAERALEPIIPSVEEFPYTIRLVSEALSSNGSTSMGSVCGSTMALMDAGVPLRAPVAGVAMGLILGEGHRHAVLTDIQGLEDHIGDMDFKVAGTAQGITALQMDIKVKGVTPQILQEALEQAREARMHILGKIREAIAAPRPTLSPYAPKILRIQIPVEKIGLVIGPGGKTIRAIIEETKATVDVEDDGSVYIGSSDAAALQKARERIEGMTREVKIGDVFTGKVTRITSFGAFVEIAPGKDGLMRLADISEEPVQRVEDAVAVGDEVTVTVIEVDRMGRINLSRRALSQGRDGPGGPRGPRPSSGGPEPFRGPPSPGPFRGRDAGPPPRSGPGGWPRRERM